MGFDDDEEPVLSPETFHNVQHTLRDLFFDATVPEAVRRHILEVSVRAPEDWHEDAVRAAYVSDDEAWRLTAVFCMRFIDGFEELILEALNSGQADMRYQAVCAAGNWGLDAAWSHVVPLATTTQVDKDLQLAAIDAVASIRPHEAPDILGDLTDSDDEDIVEATFEALTMAEGLSAYDDDDDDDDEFF
jgi:hypothetical protein